MEDSGRGPSRWTSSPLVPDNHHHATSPSDRPLRLPVTPEGTEVLRRYPGVHAPAVAALTMSLPIQVL